MRSDLLEKWLNFGIPAQELTNAQLIESQETPFERSKSMLLNYQEIAGVLSEEIPLEARRDCVVGRSTTPEPAVSVAQSGPVRSGEKIVGIIGSDPWGLEKDDTPPPTREQLLNLKGRKGLVLEGPCLFCNAEGEFVELKNTPPDWPKIREQFAQLGSHLEGLWPEMRWRVGGSREEPLWLEGGVLAHSYGIRVIWRYREYCYCPEFDSSVLLSTPDGQFSLGSGRVFDKQENVEAEVGRIRAILANLGQLVKLAGGGVEK